MLVLLLLQLSQVDKILKGVFIPLKSKPVLLFVTFQDRWSLGSSFATVFSSSLGRALSSYLLYIKAGIFVLISVFPIVTSQEKWILCCSLSRDLLSY